MAEKSEPEYKLTKIVGMSAPTEEDLARHAAAKQEWLAEHENKDVEEDANSPRNELFELILAYLPPIPNSQGWECRGTVAEQLADVLLEDNYRKVSPELAEELDALS